VLSREKKEHIKYSNLLLKCGQIVRNMSIAHCNALAIRIKYSKTANV